jgi:hypothetical protein
MKRSLALSFLWTWLLASGLMLAGAYVLLRREGHNAVANKREAIAFQQEKS